MAYKKMVTNTYAAEAGCIKQPSAGKVQLKLDVQGPKTVTAADIEVLGDAEIVNPEQVICHIIPITANH